MHFDVLTLFPELIEPYIQASIMQRAVESGVVSISPHNLRDWTTDKHHTADDTPFGGGGGMVMKPEPVFAAVESLRGKSQDIAVILMTPQGETMTHAIAERFSREERVIILCGRYEGMDERVREHLVTDEISIGDFVLSGGELPALILMEAVTRLLPGALGASNGAAEDSFASGLLEYPHYTRPAEFRGWKVPGVLTSGDHQAVNLWRRKQSWLRTLKKRPDLAEEKTLDGLDIVILKEIIAKQEAEVPQKIIEKLR